MSVSSLGYRSAFLGKALRLPKLNKNLLATLSTGRGQEIKYTHYSAFVHKQRLLPLMTAVNIKGEAFSAPVRTGNEPWDFSDQVEKQYQLAGSFYANDLNTFDRGHLVRRIDPCWGNADIASQAETETFKWINCTPQHKKLNQKGGVWYQLEQHVLEHGVKNKIADISVFAGPVLDEKDKVFTKQYKGKDFQIPVVFWKVIVWKKSNGKLYAVGFMMSQYEWIKDKLKDVPAPQRAFRKRATEALADDYFENLKFSDNKTYQVPVAAIEKATGIKFSWNNVSFPYKARAFKEVRSVPLKKVFAFDNLHPSKTQMRGVLPVGKAAGAIVKKALSKKEIITRSRQGLQATMKRYELKNITL